jgi:hypothetical protein
MGAKGHRERVIQMPMDHQATSQRKRRDVLGETPLTKARRFGHKHLVERLSINGGIE